MTIDPIEQDRRDNENLKRVLAFTLQSDSNCIDVGAHDGQILREILRCSPVGRHIAYEPLPKFFDRLVSEFPQVDVRPTALSNVKGESTFKYVRTNPGYSGLRERWYPGAEEIETITVKTECLDLSLPRGYMPALIKIDVEGAELQVLEGGIETISRYKPAIVFEHGLGAAEYYDSRPESVFDLLCRRAGLRIFDLDGQGAYTLAEFVTTFNSGQRWNFVAHR